MRGHFSPFLFETWRYPYFTFKTWRVEQIELYRQGSKISRWAQTLNICRREFCSAEERRDTYGCHRLGVWINNYHLVIVYGGFSAPVKVSFSWSLAWQRKMEIPTKMIAELREKFFKKLDEEGPSDSSTYTLYRSFSVFQWKMIFITLIDVPQWCSCNMCKGHIQTRSYIQLKIIGSPIDVTKAWMLENLWPC